MLVFHGTTKSNAENILSGNSKQSYTWTCSDDDYLYVYPLNKVTDQHGCDDEDREYAIQTAVQVAFESAAITGALINESDLVVLCWDVDESLLSDDCSCENMESVASYLDDVPDQKPLHMFTCKVNPMLQIFQLANVINMTYFNTCAINDETLKAAKMIAENGFYLDSLLEFDYNQEY